jgi:hypothetical protein
MGADANTAPNLASADELFSGNLKRRHKLVTLPVNGGQVRIQSLSEGEVSRWQTATIAASGKGVKKARLEDATGRLLVLCMVDQAGNRILGESHIARFAEEWDSADTGHLYSECAAHCGIEKDEIEDLVKNSETIHVDGTPSDSPKA